tara:strand:- start:481 stop:810 length:330 start_codon:yes stop_codon:yes gene_type:complete
VEHLKLEREQDMINENTLNKTLKKLSRTRASRKFLRSLEYYRKLGVPVRISRADMCEQLGYQSVKSVYTLVTNLKQARLINIERESGGVSTYSLTDNQEVINHYRYLWY